MKRSTQRLTALAMAAAMGFGAFGISAAESAQRLFSSNAITAEAAAAWYPTQNSVSVNVASNYSVMKTQNISQAAVNAVKSALGESALTTGVYKNYRVVYSNSTGYNNVVLLYNPSKHSALNDAFGGSQYSKGLSWMTSYLQYISTLKQLSGVSKGHIVLVLDAYNGNSPISASSFVSPYTVKLNAGASTGFENAAVSDNQNDPVRFTWSTLSLTACAYRNESTSPFISDDAVYRNLRLICATRALKKNGVAFPDVLRDNSSGSLTIRGKKYDAMPALQYAAKDMRTDYLTFKNYASISDVPSTQKFQFFRLGLLMKTALDTNVWAFYNNTSSINDILNYHDTTWNYLYALCISQNNSNINASFMNTAKQKYQSYVATMTHTMTHQWQNGGIQTTSMTEPVMIEVCSQVPFWGTYYECSRSLFRGLTSLDFILNAKDGDDDVRDITGQKIPGNTNINYWQFANKVVQ